MSASERGSSLPLSVVRKQTGEVQAGLYCILSAIGRRVLVPPPTWLNWNPISASINALFPDVWWPITSTAGASNGLWKS